MPIAMITAMVTAPRKSKDNNEKMTATVNAKSKLQRNAMIIGFLGLVKFSTFNPTSAIQSFPNKSPENHKTPIINFAIAAMRIAIKLSSIKFNISDPFSIMITAGLFNE